MDTIQKIVFYLLLIDSMLVAVIAWTGREWYRKTFPTVSRYLPITKAWAILYMALVLWIGFVSFY